MQKLKLLLPLALFIGAFFVACHEEDLPNNEKTAQVTFAGRIMDENGDAVSGAYVKAGDKSAITDKNGIFRLEPVDLPASHAILSVTGAGFFDFSRAYVVQDKALQHVTIQLLAKEIAGLVNASSGGVVDVTGGPRLTFPANAITDAQGNAYTGIVQVLAKYLDPKSPSLGLRMPGDLTGLNLAGEKQSLSTYGMVEVELESPSGQKLNIASNSAVEIWVPIDASIVANAPAEIPLWHYDLEKAYWIEEGMAQKIGNEYVGKVKHFSCWNYDGCLPSINVYGKVYLEDLDHPLSNVEVSIRPANPADGWSCGHGCTDGNGSFGGAVSKDVPLELAILWWGEPCGIMPIYTAQIGPFTTDVTLPPIILSNPSLASVSVSGRLLDCNAQPLANGYAKVTVGSSNSFMFADGDGSFESNTILCSNNVLQTGSVTGFDLTNLLESPGTAFTFPPNTVNVGDISVCTALSEYIRYSLDGGPEIVKISPIGGSDVGMTLIASEDSTQANQYIQFLFNNNLQLGTFPLTDLSVNSLYASDLNSLTTNVTTYGTNVGDLMIGTFSGNFLVFNGGSHSISGSYRVKRDW